MVSGGVLGLLVLSAVSAVGAQNSMTTMFTTKTPAITTTATPRTSTMFMTPPNITTMFTTETLAITTTATPRTSTMFMTPNITTMFTTETPAITTTSTPRTFNPTTTKFAKPILTTNNENFTTTTPTTTLFTTLPTTTMFTTPSTTTKVFTITTPPTTTKLFTTDPTTTMMHTNNTTSTIHPETTATFTIPSATSMLTATILSTTITPPTTSKTTTMLTISITTMTTSTPGPVEQCQNGGYFDGIQCVCPGDFYGTFCELIPSRITIGPVIEVQVNVDITFMNVAFSENLTDTTSEEFIHFQSVFKSEMNSIYGDVPGYKDVIIQEIRKGSILVSHRVIVEMKYKPEENTKHQYNQTLQLVKSLLEELESNNCTSGVNSLCVDRTRIMVSPITPPSEEELCMDRVPEGYETFYTPVVSSSGLACVSPCDPYSPKYLTCNDGTCQISRSGPQCLCARTDVYIYTSSQCSGKFSKLGLFIGTGVTIGVLFISCIALGVYIYVVKKSALKPFTFDDLFITTMI